MIVQLEVEGAAGGGQCVCCEFWRPRAKARAEGE